MDILLHLTGLAFIPLMIYMIYRGIADIVTEIKDLVSFGSKDRFKVMTAYFPKNGKRTLYSTIRPNRPINT